MRIAECNFPIFKAGGSRASCGTTMVVRSLASDIVEHATAATNRGKSDSPLIRRLKQADCGEAELSGKKHNRTVFLASQDTMSPVWFLPLTGVWVRSSRQYTSPVDPGGHAH